MLSSLPSVRFTVARISSRLTESSGDSSWILTTLINLSSCLTTCSMGADSASTTMVSRLNSSLSVGATASDWILNPLRANSPETLARTPGLFSTRTTRVWNCPAMINRFLVRGGQSHHYLTYLQEPLGKRFRLLLFGSR